MLELNLEVEANSNNGEAVKPIHYATETANVWPSPPRCWYHWQNDQSHLQQIKMSLPFSVRLLSCMLEEPEETVVLSSSRKHLNIREQNSVKWFRQRDFLNQAHGTWVCALHPRIDLNPFEDLSQVDQCYMLKPADQTSKFHIVKSTPCTDPS